MEDFSEVAGGLKLSEVDGVVIVTFPNGQSMSLADAKRLKLVKIS